MTIHVANIVAEFLKEIKKGFNKVKWLELYNETQTEPYEGEQTQEQFEEHMKNYAIFVAHADLYGEESLSSYDEENDYRTTEISWGSFERDFTAELQKRLGDDVQIEYRSGCHEWECIRTPGYSYIKEQEDEKDKYTMRVNGHAVGLIVQACRDVKNGVESESLQKMAEKDGKSVDQMKRKLKNLAFNVLVRYGNLI